MIIFHFSLKAVFHSLKKNEIIRWAENPTSRYFDFLLPYRVLASTIIIVIFRSIFF